MFETRMGLGLGRSQGLGVGVTVGVVCSMAACFLSFPPACAYTRAQSHTQSGLVLSVQCGGVWSWCRGAGRPGLGSQLPCGTVVMSPMISAYLSQSCQVGRRVTSQGP